MGMWNFVANSSCERPNARRMILARGVFFIRLKSDGVSGFASGSLSAAVWRWSSVIASRRLQSWSNTLGILHLVN